MIEVEHTADGYRWKGGRWRRGGIVLEVQRPERGLHLESARTVVRYNGRIGNAHGLYVFVGVSGRDGEKLTLMDLYGLVIRQVDPEHARAVRQDDRDPKMLSGLIALEAEAWATD